MQARRAPRVATVHNTIKKSGRVLPRPSAIFHAYASADTSWVARTLSHCTPVKWGKVSSNLSRYEATQFGDSICLVCVSIFKCLFIQTKPMQPLINTGGGYNLRALNLWPKLLSIFPSSILHFPLIAMPSLQLCQPFYQLFMFSTHSNHEPRYKSPKSHEWNLPPDFYRSSIR
jgi:hypothetical protein